MFIINDPVLAICFCIVTMLGWGSWANTQKLAGREHWPFPLYYWDYGIGVLLFSLLWMLGPGSMGSAGMPAIENFGEASGAAIGGAIFSGALFNAANILLVVAIDRAGMSVAFPVGVGLALVIGTAASYVQSPRGNVVLLALGVGGVLCAMIFSAIAHAKLPRSAGAESRGVLYAAGAGLLMGFFYPQLMKSVSPGFNGGSITPGLMTPYTALVCFAVGLAASSLLFNTYFVRSAGLDSRSYRRGSMRLHSLGILGGAIWMLALSLNVLASGVAGPAISYALGQGATLVAAIWGVFIWKEFRDAPSGVTPLLALMFFCYAGGLVLIGLATLQG